jgi:glutathione S-transferase
MTDRNGLRLYDYFASCNCYKVRLLLAQLGLQYERVPIDIFNGETLTDEYTEMNPSRSTPVLEMGDRRYLPESNAILVYLAKGTPYLPDDAFELAEVVRWLVYEQTDVIPTTGGLRFRLLVGRLTPSEPDAIRRREGAVAVLRLLDDHLVRNCGITRFVFARANGCGTAFCAWSGGS